MRSSCTPAAAGSSTRSPDRDRPGHRLCRPRASAGRGALRRRGGLETAFLAVLAARAEQHPRARQRSRRLPPPRPGMRVDLPRVAAHFAISSIFRSYPEQGELFCYNVRRLSHQVFRLRQRTRRPRPRMHRLPYHRRVRRDLLRRTPPRRPEPLCRCPPLRLHQRRAGRRPSTSSPLTSRIAMRRANLPEVIRLIDHFFGGHWPTRSSPSSPTSSTASSRPSSPRPSPRSKTP